MLIGLKGYKGAGKDTAADYLVNRHDFTKVAFAAKMKEAVAGLFGITVDQVDEFKHNYGNSLDLVEVHLEIAKPEAPGLASTEYTYTWREFLQRFGTEMGRNVFGKDFWVDLLIKQLPIRKEWKTALSYDLDVDGNYVVTDCRFTNEALALRRLGGFIVEVTRPGCEPDGHASEEPLAAELIDARVKNDDDVRTLYERMEETLNGFLRISAVH